MSRQLVVLVCAALLSACRSEGDEPDVAPEPAITEAPGEDANLSVDRAPTDVREETAPPADDAASSSDAAREEPDDGEAPLAPEAEAEAEYVDFPAIGVRLVRPPDFEVQETFHGFGHEESQSSVVLMTLPAPFSELSRGFTAENMAPRRMNLLVTEPRQVGGQPGLLVHFTQSAAGRVFEKWSLLFGGEERTTMVTATLPQSHADRFSERLKATVLSTQPIDGHLPAPGADLDFTLQPSPKLKLTPGPSKVLLYTRGGKVPAASPAEPLFVAASSLWSLAVEDRRQFALDRLFQTAKTKTRRIRSHERVTIDGLDGYATIADAEDAESGTPLTVYQTLLFDEGRYILMQGLVGAGMAVEYLPEFRAMAASLTRKRE